MQRIEIDVQTGKQKVVPLTTEEVADAQARTVAANHPKAAIKKQLAEIDSKTMMPRGTRECHLALSTLVDVLIAGGYIADTYRTSDNVGMVKLAQVEAQAKQLREQLAALP